MNLDLMKCVNPIEDPYRPNNFYIRIIAPPAFKTLLEQKKLGINYYRREISGTLMEAKEEARNLMIKFQTDMETEDIDTQAWKNRIICSVYASCIAYELTQQKIL